MPRRVKVVQPHNHGPRVAWAALIGAVVGVLLSLSTTVTRHYGGWQWYDDIYGFSLSVILPVLLINAAQRECRHFLWCFLIGAVAAGACITASLAAESQHLAQPLWSFRWLHAAHISISLLAGGVLNLLMLPIRWLICRRLVRQDGTYCPTCAYTITGLPSNRCPECGIVFTEDEVEPRQPRVRPELVRWLAWTGGLVFASIAVCLVYPTVLAWMMTTTRWNPAWMTEYLSMRPMRSVHALGSYLEDEDPEGRATAAWTIAEIGRLTARPIRQGGSTWRSPSAIQLEQSDAVTVRLVQLALDGPQLYVRTPAMNALSWVQPDRLVAIMPDLLRDDDPNVRFTAISSLNVRSFGHPAHPRAAEFLIDALADQDVTVRTASWGMLVRISGQQIPYNPNASSEQRLAQQQKWREWWNDQQDD